VLRRQFLAEVVAVRSADGRILASAAAPIDPAYTRLNANPDLPAPYQPLFVPGVANVDYQYHLTYGGWGISHAVVASEVSVSGQERWESTIFMSTFHRVLAYRPAMGQFNTLPGLCGKGVGAMSAAARIGVLYLARYTGHMKQYEIYDYGLAVSIPLTNEFSLLLQFSRLWTANPALPQPFLCFGDPSRARLTSVSGLADSSLLAARPRSLFCPRSLHQRIFLGVWCLLQCWSLLWGAFSGWGLLSPRLVGESADVCSGLYRC
jgi:hypothetical protein